MTIFLQCLITPRLPFLQALRGQLEEQRPVVEHSLETGRLFLREEGVDDKRHSADSGEGKDSSILLALQLEMRKDLVWNEKGKETACTLPSDWNSKFTYICYWQKYKKNVRQYVYIETPLELENI